MDALRHSSRISGVRSLSPEELGTVKITVTVTVRISITFIVFVTVTVLFIFNKDRFTVTVIFTNKNTFQVRV